MNTKPRKSNVHGVIGVALAAVALLLTALVAPGSPAGAAPPLPVQTISPDEVGSASLNTANPHHISYSQIDNNAKAGRDCPQFCYLRHRAYALYDLSELPADATITNVKLSPIEIQEYDQSGALTLRIFDAEGFSDMQPQARYNRLVEDLTLGSMGFVSEDTITPETFEVPDSIQRELRMRVQALHNAGRDEIGLSITRTDENQSAVWVISDLKLKIDFNSPTTTTPPTNPTPAPTGPSCGGHEATIIGTDGDDIIKGTTGRDVIVGGKGNDTIDGRWGGDLICGGDGDDVIDAGDGYDRIWGQSGDDTIKGGNKPDLIDGGPGNDILEGNDEDDEIHGGEGDDIIRGGLNGDYINGGPGNDDIDGDAGWDRIVGGAGNDWIRGSGGQDILTGGDGNDSLSGQAGKDELHGGAGTDHCNGGARKDKFSGCETTE